MKVEKTVPKKVIFGAIVFLLFAGGAFAACGPAVPICLDNILDPYTIQKYAEPLTIPPAMPTKGTVKSGGKSIAYYEIAAAQFTQQVLPAPMNKTTVWGYGAANNSSTFNWPAYTIEAKTDKAVRVKWINSLVDIKGNFLPHLFAVDQTLHWANPPGPRDSMGIDANPYGGPVPIVTHLHGAHVTQESDGYPEAWYLPAAKDIPSYINYKTGSFYEKYKAEFFKKYGVTWPAGSAIFQYSNDQRATTLWYHDHVLGITRLNVQAGLAGFYFLRGGSSDVAAGVLPGPAPALGDKAGKKYYEIPILIQDRIFNKNGSLFFPSNRAFFEGLLPDQLQIPFIPASNPYTGQLSDVPPIWNPEFFGNTIVVNGKTWPYLNVEQRRYRFRLLNGCNARTLILKFDDPRITFWLIGSDGGFLPAPVNLSQLLQGSAERYDVIVDFTGIPVNTKIHMLNLAPDSPYGGGFPGDRGFVSSDPATTGQVMEFRVVPLASTDTSTPPANLRLPAFTPLGNVTFTRKVSLNELESATVKVITEANGTVIVSNDRKAVPFGPTIGLLGTVDASGAGVPLDWSEPITENPAVGSTEIWEIYDFTADAHPIHVHQTQFQVIDRRPIVGAGVGQVLPPQPWETGFKDTAIALPGYVTRIKTFFDIPGRYVWHCHILDHEDHDMMRPMQIGPQQ